MDELNHDTDGQAETHTDEQEKALIAAMAAADGEAANDADFDPEAAQATAKQEADNQQMALMGATMTAEFGLGAIEMAVQSFVHPRFQIPERNRDEVLQNCAPLLVKYGALIPEWLAAYQEEIAALKAIGSLGIASYGEIKQLQAEDAALLAEKEASNDGETAPETADREAA